MAASSPSGPLLRSRSTSSGIESPSSCSERLFVRRSQSRGRWSGGVCQKIFLMFPSFIWTVTPWGSSTVTSMRWRRRSRPQMSPSEAPLFRLTSARRPGSASAARARAAPALPPRHALLLDLGARGAVAADAREVAARRLESAAVGQRRLEARHLRLEAADLLEVLVLAERRLDRAPDGRHVLPRRQQERDGAVAQLELAQDRLRRAVHDAHHVLEAVADVEGHDALALGVDAAPARPAGHLGQLVVSERAEAAVRALGQGLQHHALGRHVDAERHGLGGEDHLAEPALEEELDQALHGGQHARVVEPHAHAETPGRWTG